MELVGGLKGVLGKMNPFASKQAKPPAPAQKQTPPAQTVDGEVTIDIRDSTFDSSLQMTPQEIMQRNYAVLSKVSFDAPFHEKFMEGAKETWRVVGPIAFIVFTAGEVFYYLHHFMAKTDDSLMTNVLLWGVTLLIEIPFAIATYDLSGRKKRAMHARLSGQQPPDRDTAGAVAAWCVMAAVNIAGQVAFLVFVTQVAGMVAAEAIPIYLFVFLRVIGVLIGDAYTAFFLSPSSTKLSRVLAFQKAQAQGIDQLSEASIERQRKESHAELELERNAIAIKREKREAQFLSEFAERNMQSALQQQRRFLGDQVTKVEEIEAPNTEDL